MGGLLTEYLNWRWSLYVNVPIALAALLGAPAFLRDRSRRRGGHLDVPGALLGCGGLVALVYGFSEAEPRGWTSPSVLTLLVAGVILLAAFVWWQSRAASPMLPLRIVKDRVRAGSLATMGLATIGMFGVFLFLTYYLQVVLGYPPVRTGLAFVPISAGIVIGATQIAARLLPRTAPRTLMSSGMVLAAVGMVLLSRLTVHAQYVPHVLPALLLLGLGMGLTFMPVYATATMRRARAGRRCGLGCPQHRSADGRFAGHRTAQHHRHRRHQPLRPLARARSGPQRRDPQRRHGARLLRRLLVLGGRPAARRPGSGPHRTAQDAEARRK